MNELVLGVESTSDDASVVLVVACRPMCVVVLAVVSFVSGAIMILSLGDNDFDMVVLMFGAFVLSAISMAFMDAMFASKFNAFSCCFLFWECFSCLGPGMLSVKDNIKKLRMLVNWCWVLWC